MKFPVAECMVHAGWRLNAIWDTWERPDGWKITQDVLVTLRGQLPDLKVWWAISQQGDPRVAIEFIMAEYQDQQRERQTKRRRPRQG